MTGRHTSVDGAASPKTRVLFVMIHMAMGGSERLIFNLVKNLDRRRFEPSIAWLTSERPLAEFEALGIPLYCVPKVGRFDWNAIQQIADIIRRGRIDVVNAHHFLSYVYAYYGAKIARRRRLVYTEHSEADVRAVPSKWQVIGKFLLRSSDGAIGVSDVVTRALQSHFGMPPTQVHTIENGVDLGVFRANDDIRQRMREQLGLAARDVVVGHVANFRRNKNHLFLLRALQQVVRDRPNVKLLLVGTGQQEDRENSEPDVAQFIDRAGLGASVRMLGYRSDVADLLRAMDIFCLVSYREGLPLSAVEAMASALPIIATDIDAMRCVIEPDVNGLLVRADDVPGLTRSLMRLADDGGLRRRMGEVGCRIAHSRYSLTRCVQQTQDVLLSTVRGPATDTLSPASTVSNRVSTDSHCG